MRRRSNISSASDIMTLLEGTIPHFLDQNGIVYRRSGAIGRSLTPELPVFRSHLTARARRQFARRCTEMATHPWDTVTHIADHNLP
ncbi:MAG TPA: hypothetical protein DD856_17895 [Sulfobacillus sp.]|nr:hypothetical protein [Sulfobacillus sp.]